MGAPARRGCAAQELQRPGDRMGHASGGPGHGWGRDHRRGRGSVGQRPYRRHGRHLALIPAYGSGDPV